MKDWTAIRTRYLRDNLPVRLVGLAANLGRIKSFAAHDASREAVESIINESKLFIEWTAADAEVNTAAELVELQVQLARWQRNWARIWADPVERKKIAEQSGAWSTRVLEMSGLLTRTIREDFVFAHSRPPERFLRSGGFRRGAHAPCSRLTRANPERSPANAGRSRSPEGG